MQTHLELASFADRFVRLTSQRDPREGLEPGQLAPGLRGSDPDVHRDRVDANPARHDLLPPPSRPFPGHRVTSWSSCPLTGPVSDSRYPPPEMLSKSRFMAGLQCPKRLWFEVNAREQVPPTDAATQAIFDQGTEVGRVAQGLFPGGVEIDRRQFAWDRAVAATAEALGRRVPLYEAAFAHLGAGCRVDILVPVEEGGAWDLVEIKGTSEVKEEHLEDVAFQTWVLRGAGVPLRRSLLGHLDSTYVRSGPLDLDRLFKLEDLTDRIDPILPGMPEEVRRLQAVATLEAHPGIGIGRHCSEPHPCRLEPVCWSEVPDGSVLELYAAEPRSGSSGMRASWGSRRSPRARDSPSCSRSRSPSHRSGRPHIDRPALRQFLGRLEYPIHYLDFEAFALAIPPFDNTRPFQQIPFQFSLQVVDHPGAAVRSTAFLAEGAGDPRPEFAAALRQAVGATGSIVVYNQTFERGRIQELARDLPGPAGDARRPPAADRRPLRALRALRLSRSLSVRQLVDQGRSPRPRQARLRGAQIQEGGAAAREFLRSVDPATPANERAAIRDALLEYCGLDTAGMVEIVAALEQLAQGSEPAP